VCRRFAHRVRGSKGIDLDSLFRQLWPRTKQLPDSTFGAYVPWHPNQGSSEVHILIPCVFAFIASDEHNLFLLVLWSVGTVLPSGLRNASLAATSHGNTSFRGTDEDDARSFELMIARRLCKEC